VRASVVVLSGLASSSAARIALYLAKITNNVSTLKCWYNTNRIWRYQPTYMVSWWQSKGNCNSETTLARFKASWLFSWWYRWRESGK
jgi:hypothetical protein